MFCVPTHQQRKLKQHVGLAIVELVAPVENKKKLSESSSALWNMVEKELKLMSGGAMEKNERIVPVLTDLLISIDETSCYITSSTVNNPDKYYISGGTTYRQ